MPIAETIEAMKAVKGEIWLREHILLTAWPESFVPRKPILLVGGSKSGVSERQFYRDLPARQADGAGGGEGQ
jgi:hypothetical protein